MLRVKYLYQSGFTIETENHFLVIDYYKGDLSLPDKNTSFFVSHNHTDHFNQDIFKYKDRSKYILSDDILGYEEAENIKIVKAGDQLKYNGMDIVVFGSTDQGVSFFISLDGVNIFHSGDLNWWAWEDMGEERELEREDEYKSEINRLKSLGHKIDLAFVPVDPRLLKNYYLAGDYFIRTIRPSYFFPMHFGDNYSYNKDFIHKMLGFDTHIFNIGSRNQVFEIDI